MWYDRRTASPLEPLSRRTMTSKRRLFEMRLACLGGGLVLALSVSSGCSHTEDSVGFVLENYGDWYLEKAPSKTLSEGQEVPAGAKIRPKEEGQAGEKCLLTICLYNGQPKFYRRIDCIKGAATLPARPDPSSVNRLCRAIGGRYAGGYIHALSRGKEISDGVVRQEKGRIDLAAVFHADIPGEHQVQFRPTAQSSANPPGPVTIRFVWDPKRSTTVNTVGLRPGLYECTVLSQGGQWEGDATAWVLVSESPAYERAADTYREAVALSEAWDDDVSPHAVVSFRRACLKTLAEPTWP